MTIFIRAQALDNRSPDSYLIDGHLHTAVTDEVTRHLQDSHDLRKRGWQSFSDDTVEITQDDQTASLVIETSDHDIRGRRAPISATVPVADISPERSARTADDIVAAAASIGRTIDRDALAASLEEWWLRPKGPRGWVLTAWAWIWKLFTRPQNEPYALSKASGDTPGGKNGD